MSSFSYFLCWTWHSHTRFQGFLFSSRPQIQNNAAPRTPGQKCFILTSCGNPFLLVTFQMNSNDWCGGSRAGCLVSKPIYFFSDLNYDPPKYDPPRRPRKNCPHRRADRFEQSSAHWYSFSWGRAFSGSTGRQKEGSHRGNSHVLHLRTKSSKCTVSIRCGRNTGSTWAQLRPARP